MQPSVICLAVLLFVASAIAAPQKPYYDLNDAPQLFEKFIRDYHRHYVDASDRHRHYLAFVESLKHIDAQNAADDSAVYDINKFADYTPEEQKNMFGYYGPGHFG